MSEHPDYTQFRREMFAGIGLPVNSHHTHNWRNVPVANHMGVDFVHIIQSPEEIKRFYTWGYPIAETLFSVPDWTWCPRWVWRFIPSHLELWYHKHQDILAEERQLEAHWREQYDKAVAEYRRMIDLTGLKSRHLSMKAREEISRAAVKRVRDE